MTIGPQVVLIQDLLARNVYVRRIDVDKRVIAGWSLVDTKAAEFHDPFGEGNVVTSDSVATDVPDATPADNGKVLTVNAAGNYVLTDAAVAQNRQHVTDAAVLPGTAGSPTLAEVQAAVTTGAYTDTLIYYTGDNLPASAPTHSYWADAAGVLTILEVPDDATVGNYTDTFVIADFTGPAGSLYTITVPAATHMLTSVVEVIVQEDTGGGVYQEAIPDNIMIDASQNVSFTVSETPDGRFNGRYVLKS